MDKNGRKWYCRVMTKRSYDQTCGLATALDIIGERWTLLILRDLVPGPQRYTDLLNGLPGIGTNLLASRLGDLESLGVIRKRELPPPAASTVYELTEDGKELRPMLSALARWGGRYMAVPESADAVPVRTIVIALWSHVDANRARGVQLAIELRLDGEAPYTVTVADGVPDVQQGRTARADAAVTASKDAVMALALGRVTIDEAEAAGMLAIEGDRGAVVQLFDLLDATSLGSRSPAAAASA